jgi:hypothetical protein
MNTYPLGLRPGPGCVIKGFGGDAAVSFAPLSPSRDAKDSTEMAEATLSLRAWRCIPWGSLGGGGGDRSAGSGEREWE